MSIPTLNRDARPDLVTVCFHRGVQVIESEGQLWVPKAAYDAVLKDLDDASPEQACDCCGKVFRWHKMVAEEGDRWECFDCWHRENVRERKETIL